MALRLEVEFERRPAVYLPGEEVHGRLLVHVTVPEIRLRVLRVRVDGSAQTELKEGAPGVTVLNSTEDGRHAARQRLLHADIPLLPRRAHALPQGVHPFPFAFAIAATTPGSLRLEHGSIRYGVQATAAPSELLARAVTCWTEFEVRPRLLVAGRPALRQPGIVTGAVADRELTNRGYTLRLARRGLSPGELAVLELHASAALLARLAAEPGLLQLVQVVQYRPDGARLSEPSLLAREVVPGARFAGWEHVELRVPADAPHTVPPESCAVLGRTFHIRVNTALIQARIPLVIGTCPEDAQPPPPPPLPPPPEEPPPSYEEAMRQRAAEG
ncbi:Arrestin domain-containing protein 2 [Amphibalanus amphitrite]|uniref:Arrestin domain-containing protein 2 n=1 Tax=Amphibalanus amphitrite TaxID=1232801 RepID=A0A6A4X238_AMPAM|nr:Arrestin domain-containing protein 2 [Amphibalanus amphitrite]